MGQASGAEGLFRQFGGSAAQTGAGRGVAVLSFSFLAGTALAGQKEISHRVAFERSSGKGCGDVAARRQCYRQSRYHAGVSLGYREAGDGTFTSMVVTGRSTTTPEVHSSVRAARSTLYSSDKGLYKLGRKPEVHGPSRHAMPVST